MSHYSLNLPHRLQQEAEQWAARQGVSLDQFILWAVAEKVGECKQQLDDPAFPRRLILGFEDMLLPTAKECQKSILARPNHSA